MPDHATIVSIACPKSGCSARNATTTINTPKLINLPGGPPGSFAEAISHAEIMMKTGFRNSDGWREMKPSEYQRVAPLPKSVPKAGSNIRAAAAKKNPITPSRRTMSGDIIDVPNMTTNAMPPKNACR